MNYMLLVYIFLTSLQISAFAAQGFGVTREELTLMPPYCTALLGQDVGLPNFKDSPLRDTVPAGCPALNHYCYGLKAMIRVDRNRGVDQSFWLTSAIGHFRERTSGWEKEAPTCSIRPEAYTNLGKALLRQNKALVGQAIMNYSKALELRPDYLPAYLALSDAYLGLGKKGEALHAAEQGLKYLPDSKGLLRRFKELGGKTPPTPVAAAIPAAPAEPGKVTAGPQPMPGQNGVPGTAPQQSAGTGAVSEHSVTPPVPSPGKTEAEHAATQQAPGAPEETKIGTPTNPYCRFCPPE